MYRLLVITFILVINVFYGRPEDSELDPTIVRNLAKVVRSGNYSELFQYMDYFDLYFREVIKESYNEDIKNVDPVLKFIQDCPSNYKDQGYEELFNAMNKHENDMWSEQGFKLINIIRKKDRNSPLLSELPDYIFKLFFESVKCSLTNIYFEESFYGSYQFFNDDEDRRYVLTNIANPTQTGYIQRYYEDVFTVQNNFGEYLYADEDDFAYDAERRYVFTSSLKDSILKSREWKIEPQHPNSNLIKIRNVKFDEIMFADANIKFVTYIHVIYLRKGIEGLLMLQLLPGL